MITIAVLLFGIKIINWHYVFPAAWEQALAALVPINLNPSVGIVALEFSIGPSSAVTPAADSKAIQASLPKPPTPASPDVVLPDDGPAPSDIVTNNPETQPL